MKMLKARKGSLTRGTIEKAFIGVIMITVLFAALTTLIPQAQTAGDALNASGVPLGSLFVSGGVIFLIVMAGVLMLVLNHFMGGKKR